MTAGLLAACSATSTGKPGASASATPSDARSDGSAVAVSQPVENVGAGHMTTAASYDDVLKAIKAAMAPQYTAGRNYATDGAVSLQADTGLNGAPIPMPSADAGENAKIALSQTSAGAAGYSRTNVQVPGVDEGDIVKTDGQYIYVLRNSELIVFKADGASTARVSSLKIGSGDSGVKPMPYDQKAPENTVSVSEYASDLYVSGDTAAVITSYNSFMPYTEDDSGKEIAKPVNTNKQIAKVYMVDISDRSAPSVKTELGQDGTVLTSRLIGSTLYLISNYYVYNIKESDSGTFVPRLYAGSGGAAVSFKCIAIMPDLNSAAYTVVCAYDLGKGALTANQSILGGGTTVYMNEDTLYVASTVNKQTAGNEHTESVYTVVDYTSASVTDIASFSLPALTAKASGSVAGSLYGQFALDEYGGNLRVVTTTFSQSWSEYTDKAMGFVNYKWKEPSSANTLTVLGGDLSVIGSMGDLAPKEQVYSVRFDGPTAYIVTFRQVDPLFAVDLTDPKNPTVKSALKIPGFSEYLHVYGDGRLFGLGMDADESTGRTSGMKLTMFDTTNPDDVRVKNSLKLDTDWSTALYNHKAILISPEKGIIAFPADNGYDIYGYSDDQGFFKRAHIDTLQWSGDSRGLYIDNLAYIVDQSSIFVLDMSEFLLLNRISY
jgi:uncharacterized secreted protein with C-terminal beta-propeller domain